jgi:hypothetical protein
MTLGKAYEDLKNYILQEPEAYQAGMWSKSPIKDVLLEVLKFCPDLENVSHNQIRSLISRYQNSSSYTGMGLKLGNTDVHINERDTRIEGQYIRTSPTMEGVFVNTNLPLEEGLVEKAESAIRSAIKQVKYKGPPFVGVFSKAEHIYSSVSHYFLKCPRVESEGFYNIHLHIAHQIPRKFEEQILAAVKEMDFRYKSKYRLMGELYGSELWARDHLDQVPGAEYLRSKILSVSFETSGEVKKIYSSVEAILVGDNFKAKHMNLTSYNNEAIRKEIRNHLKNLELSKKESLKIDYVVAAAIRSANKEYQARAIQEIKSLVEGKALAPVNPRKRKFSNFSIDKGVVTAPVTLSRNVRFIKNKIHLGEHGDLSKVVIMSMKGRNVDEVVSHPWLPSVKIRKSDITGSGKGKCLTLNIEAKHENLEDLIKELNLV